MQKLLTFFSKNISVYAIFNDQNFNDTLTNDIISFELLGPGLQIIRTLKIERLLLIDDGVLNNSTKTMPAFYG